jgi:cyanate permease
MHTNLIDLLSIGYTYCFENATKHVWLFVRVFAVQKYRRDLIMLGTFLCGVGCFVVIFKAYWACVLAAAMIGAGYGMTLVPICSLLIGFGTKHGLTEEQARTFAPNMSDAFVGFTKMIGYIIASVMITHLEYPTTSMSFGICMFIVPVIFTLSFDPKLADWFEVAARPEASPV